MAPDPEGPDAVRVESQGQRVAALTVTFAEALP